MWQKRAGSAARADACTRAGTCASDDTDAGTGPVYRANVLNRLDENGRDEVGFRNEDGYGETGRDETGDEDDQSGRGRQQGSCGHCGRRRQQEGATCSQALIPFGAQKGPALPAFFLGGVLYRAPAEPVVLIGHCNFVNATVQRD